MTENAVCKPCERGRHEDCTLHDKCGCEECNPPVVVWKDPPTPARGGPRIAYITAEQVAELRAHPKRWALLGAFEKKTRAASGVKAITQGRGGAVIADLDDWEFAARITGPSSSELYAKYNGRPE